MVHVNTRLLTFNFLPVVLPPLVSFSTFLLLLSLLHVLGAKHNYIWSVISIVNCDICISKVGINFRKIYTCKLPFVNTLYRQELEVEALVGKLNTRRSCTSFKPCSNQQILWTLSSSYFALRQAYRFCRHRKFKTFHYISLNLFGKLLKAVLSE